MHQSCDWCGRTLRESEGVTQRSKINPCTNQTILYYLCDDCNKFPSKEGMEYYKGYLVNWALLDVPIELESIDSVCDNGEWKVTLNIKVKYSGETSLVRKGWIA